METLIVRINKKIKALSQKNFLNHLIFLEVKEEEKFTAAEEMSLLRSLCNYNKNFYNNLSPSGF